MAEHFVASAATVCSALARQATSAAQALDTALASLQGQNDPAIARLAVLSIRLLQFSHHADQLGDILSDAATITPTLQSALADALPECEKALALVTEQTAQVRLVGPETPERALDADVASQYEVMLAAYSRMFFFAMQILTV